MLIFRKIVFYLFLLIYFIAAPLMILYALGYIFTPDSEEYVVETGTVFLSTTPGQASIYINGKIYGSRTPAAVSGLVPDKYDLKIFLEGYRVWDSSVNIEAGKADTIDKILLIPEEFKKDILSKGSFRELKGYPGNLFFIVAPAQKAKSQLLYEYMKEKIFSLTNPSAPYAEKEATGFYFTKKSSAVITALSGAGQTTFLWADLEGDNLSGKDITGLLPKDPKFITWEPGNEDRIFAFYKEGDLYNIDKINISTEEVAAGFIAQCRGFGVFNNRIYVIENDHTIKSYDYAKENTSEILADSKIGKSIFENSEYVKIIPLGESRLVFLDENGALFANKLPYEFVKEGVTQIDFDENSGKLLILTKNRIGIIDLEKDAAENTEFEKPPRFEWIYHSKNSIKDAFWVYDASHVILLEEDKAYLLPVAGALTGSAEFLFNVMKDSGIFYTDRTGLIYYLDTDGRLVSAELLSVQDILQAVMPKEGTKEKSGIDKK